MTGYPRLIVNGDDFGISEETNEAIIRAFREGALTSCSLMVSGKAFEHAVQLARDNDRLSVGIHLVTVMGKSVLPHGEIPHLVDSEGNFPSNPTVCGLKYYFLPVARRELKKELEAQFEKFRSTGLKGTHIDSHLHMHVHPVIFKAAVELGERFGIRKMRVPRDDLRLSLQADPENRWEKIFGALVFRLLTRAMQKKLRAKGFCFAHRVYGHLMSGKINHHYVRSVLEALQSGKTSELYFHPSIHSDGSDLSSEDQRCFEEYKLLVGRQFLEWMEELEITRISYGEMDRWD